MTDASRTPGTLARAEAGSRQFMLHLGLGVGAFIFGQYLANSVLSRLVERGVVVETEAAAFGLRWILDRLWLLLVLPGAGWLGGRFLDTSAKSLTTVAVLSGEIFSVSIVMALSGPEWLFPSVADAVARFATLAAGFALTYWACRAGQGAAEVSQADAALAAAAAKAEYAEFLRRAEEGPGGGAPGAVSGDAVRLDAPLGIPAEAPSAPPRGPVAPGGGGQGPAAQSAAASSEGASVAGQGAAAVLEAASPPAAQAGEGGSPTSATPADESAASGDDAPPAGDGAPKPGA